MASDAPDTDVRVRPSRRPWVLLLVDDEEDILESYQELLESSLEGVRVLTTTSGREGLDLLDAERIDVILSDFKMPGMDGVEFLYQCRRHHTGIPRVMLTAFASEDLARRAVVEAVVDEFLSKTASPEELIQRIARLLRYEPGEASVTGLEGAPAKQRDRPPAQDPSGR